MPALCSGVRPHLYLPGLFALKTFLKRWCRTKDSLHPACKTCKNVRVRWLIVYKNLSVLLCLGEQIPVSLTFWPLLHVLGICSSSGSYYLWVLWFPTFWASTVQTDLILCCRELPGDFREGSIPPCSGGSKETAPGRHIAIISSVLQSQKDEDKLQAI